MKTYLCFLTVLTASSQIETTSGSVCKPLSSFKIDCNICSCSLTGTTYTCSQKVCQPINPEDFIQEINDQGFMVLKPKPAVKPQDRKFDDSEETYVLRRPQSHPYIKDEIPQRNNIEPPPEILESNYIDKIISQNEHDEKNENNYDDDVDLETDPENFERENYDILRRIMQGAF